MDVILLEKIHKLGDLGEQVKVKSGFGRNYLIPNGKAVSATPENIAYLIPINDINNQILKSKWERNSLLVRKGNFIVYYS